MVSFSYQQQEDVIVKRTNICKRKIDHQEKPLPRKGTAAFFLFDKKPINVRRKTEHISLLTFHNILSNFNAVYFGNEKFFKLFS